MLPARRPNLNACAERWVRSIKEECLSKLILFGETSLGRALAEFLKHSHHERNHQGKDNLLLFPAPAPPHHALTLQLPATNDWVVCSSFTNRPHEIFDLMKGPRLNLARANLQTSRAQLERARSWLKLTLFRTGSGRPLY